jgi:hypothetical protein
MFALVTLVWILSCAPCFGWSDLVNPVKRPVVVYLRTNAGQPNQPLQEMKREANALMDTAGYRLEWRSLTGQPVEAVEAAVAVVELRGICEVPEPSAALVPLEAASSLASTAVSNGEVLPFSWLECGTLSRMLAASLTGDDGRQEFLYGRAMGRLVAHELYHILTKRREHDGGGIGKSHFSARDVLAEHFVFDSPAVGRLREPVAEAEDISFESLGDAGR